MAENSTTIIPVHAMMTYMRDGITKELMSNVGLGLPFKPEAGIEPPKPYETELIAVWDTGATGTTITTEVAKKFKFESMGAATLRGVTGCASCTRYLVSLHLPNGVIVPEVEVTDCEGDIGCDVLIGMDIISLGDFAVSNYDGRTTFTFRIPSVERIDFTKHVGTIHTDNIQIKTKNKRKVVKHINKR